MFSITMLHAGKHTESVL